MKKFLKTLIPFLLVTPMLLSGCGGKKSSGNDNPSDDTPADTTPTAATLIENIQVVYDVDFEDDSIIDDSHLSLTLPKQEQFALLGLKIKVKGESEKRDIASPTFSLVGTYDAEKVELDEGWLKIKDATSFTLKVNFHFEDTNEDVEKQWTTSWSLPTNRLVYISRYNYTTVSNYGLSFADNHGFPESTSDANQSLAEMTPEGVYGFAIYTQLQKLIKVTYTFKRAGCFSSVSTWATKWENRSTFVEKDGDIKVHNVYTEVSNNILVVDFSEKADNFTEAPYAFNCWFWNDDDVSENNSLIESIMIEYVPYVE